MDPFHLQYGAFFNQRASSVMGSVFINAQENSVGGIPIMTNHTVSGNWVILNTLPNNNNVLIEPNLPSPLGPPHILEATWALKHINNTSRGTCNEWFNIQSVGSSVFAPIYGLNMTPFTLIVTCKVLKKRGGYSQVVYKHLRRYYP